MVGQIWRYTSRDYACSWDYGRARVLQQPQENLQFIGVINNPGKAAAGRVHVNVMLYDASQQLIGFGDGAPQSATLQPGEQTAFQINCEMFGREPVAAYDYLIESERQS